MIRSVKYLVLFFLFEGEYGFGSAPSSIDTLFVLPDSTKPFTIENFYEIILQNHPVARHLLAEVPTESPGARKF